MVLHAGSSPDRPALVRTSLSPNDLLQRSSTMPPHKSRSPPAATQPPRPPSAHPRCSPATQAACVATLTATQAAPAYVATLQDATQAVPACVAESAACVAAQQPATQAVPPATAASALSLPLPMPLLPLPPLPMTLPFLFQSPLFQLLMLACSGSPNLLPLLLLRPIKKRLPSPILHQNPIDIQAAFLTTSLHTAALTFHTKPHPSNT
ncbi:hypothetical protein O6H91_06G065700 [Diphasiastrum complanatum]|uniref:Uncharacterized protein n=1 Tax=Diphasiastrum complanatum TaxID=34168 RepID=A0ACC2DEM8_DIPCM|nr:hypothetical protein O6H91_06G065700 [Diphasiastrum complanatum]